jgi:ABC-type multidrug transport system ATPase subunit
LDTESEKVVQEALDVIMADTKLITIVIAHRLSTIRGASRIAYVDHGKVREIGTYAELMAKPHGLYKRLETLQSMDSGLDRKSILDAKAMYEAADAADEEKTNKNAEEITEQEEIDQETAKKNQNKAKNLARSEYPLYFIGSIGAFMQGIMYVFFLMDVWQFVTVLIRSNRFALPLPPQFPWYGIHVRLPN